MTEDSPFRPTAGDALPGGRNPEGPAVAVPLEVAAVAGRAWEITLRSKSVVAAAVLIPLIPQLTGAVASQILQALATEARDPEEQLRYLLPALGLRLLTTLVALWLTLGQVRVVSRLARGLDAEGLMVFGELGRYPAALGVWLMASVAIGAGTCFFVVPGLIASVGLGFALFALIDQDLGPVDALSESWRLTDGHKLRVFLVGLAVASGALLVSVATLGLGLVVAAPVLVLSQGVMYHSLLHLQPRLDGARSPEGP